MQYPKIVSAQLIIQLCELYNIRHIVISPGSRNAPLTIGFYENNFFNCYSIVDERSAAFFALGIAQQTRNTVALVCTSGSALLNYYPAVAEAFYSDIPLAIISADRPIEKIDIGDGQTIRQQQVFANHILHSTQLVNRTDAFSKNENYINIALQTAISKKGPVHINVPFEEPLYETTTVPFKTAEKIPLNVLAEGVDKNFEDFINRWNTSSKKMVLIGLACPGIIHPSFIEYLANDESVIVFTETTSNVHHKHFFPGIDKVIAPIEKMPEMLLKLQPEILLTFGGMIISKKVKAFLRSYKPEYHYHVDAKKAYDTYFCLSHHFKLSPNIFFEQIGSRLIHSVSAYRSFWLEIQDLRRKAHLKYLENLSFSDLIAYQQIFRTIPNNYYLQLSNSSTVRYAQLFDLNTTLKVFCNRGTSGIDGSTSTAIGAAVVTGVPTLLITGDLSFFYDSNALWNNYTPANFRMIVINNGGGGIFRILPGPKNTDNFATYFETKHTLNAKHLCKMYQIQYTSADSVSSLTEALQDFYSTSVQPKLIEIFTPRTLNDELLIKYFSFLKDNS